VTSGNAMPAARRQQEQGVTTFDHRPVINADLQQAFRAALSLWPSGVAIVTTLDTAGRRWGFTASAFSSVSLEPPLILVCLATDAHCYEAFVSSETFAINMLRRHHRQLALRFATKSAEKFRETPFLQLPAQPPVMADALAVLECERRDAIAAGDHTILIGAVTRASSDAQPSAPETALVYLAKHFRSVAPEHFPGHDLGPDLPWFF
jgi:flavin reductase ActVB